MPTTLEPGVFLFRIVRDIGYGGLGRVDEIEVTDSACEYRPGRRLARKRLNDRWKDHPTAQARFEREIAAVHTLDHPSIVPYRGENLDNDPERFYCMPLYRRNLRHLMASRAAGFPRANVAGFGATIADALGHAHAHGFIHRDLKPENILLKSDNSPVIADWGLGYFVHRYSVVLEQLTRGGMGTEYYCSWEQWTTGKCDGRGDIYSLGVVLAELALGRQPQFRVGFGISKDVLVPATPGAVLFNDLIRDMTSLLADDRPDSMRVVAVRLRQVARTQ